MNPYIADSSVIIALIRGERLEERVALLAAQKRMVISAVNYAEVMQVAVRKLPDAAKSVASVESLDLNVVEFTKHQSITAARLWPATCHLGLSLGDRACLALAEERKMPVLTTDRIWAKLDLGIKIEIVRR
jgi:ribonuclease VapC